jgi:hypothetical protein
MTGGCFFIVLRFFCLFIRQCDMLHLTVIMDVSMDVIVSRLPVSVLKLLKVGAMVLKCGCFLAQNSLIKSKNRFIMPLKYSYLQNAVIGRPSKTTMGIAAGLMTG